MSSFRRQLFIHYIISSPAFQPHYQPLTTPYRYKKTPESLQPFVTNDSRTGHEGKMVILRLDLPTTAGRREYGVEFRDVLMWRQAMTTAPSHAQILADEAQVTLSGGPAPEVSLLDPLPPSLSFGQEMAIEINKLADEIQRDRDVIMSLVGRRPAPEPPAPPQPKPKVRVAPTYFNGWAILRQILMSAVQGEEGRPLRRFDGEKPVFLLQSRRVDGERRVERIQCLSICTLKEFQQAMEDVEERGWEDVIWVKKDDAERLPFRLGHGRKLKMIEWGPDMM